MSVLTEVFQALRSVGVDEDRAMKVATAMSNDFQEIKRDLAVLKWAVGLLVAGMAGQYAILFRLLQH